MWITRAFCITGLSLFVSLSSFGERTEIEVRVLSKGAKFIGTSMGGVSVVIRDAETGVLLAEGVTSGSTGNTAKIMKDRKGPKDPVSTPDAAVFQASLELDSPRLLEVSAFGPLGQRQAANRVSMTQWVVPGKHIRGGDGWLLELPGFVVDVLSPPAHVKLPGGAQEVRISANVTMMCGCPIEPGGLWDADEFEVAVILKRNGQKATSRPLKFAGKRSQFECVYKVEERGVYEAIVYAYDPRDGNTGLDRTTFIVTE